MEYTRVLDNTVLLIAYNISYLMPEPAPLEAYARLPVMSNPVLLIHGKDDVVVPIKQSERMRDTLEDENKPVEMLVLDSEDHWLSPVRGLH